MEWRCNEDKAAEGQTWGQRRTRGRGRQAYLCLHGPNQCKAEYLKIVTRVEWSIT